MSKDRGSLIPRPFINKTKEVSPTNGTRRGSRCMARIEVHGKDRGARRGSRCTVRIEVHGED